MIKPSYLLWIPITFGFVACKLASNNSSDLNVVGGQDISSSEAIWRGVRPVATGCTGTMVTLGDQQKSNYLLTLTSCANELVPPGKETLWQREAVARETDSSLDENHKLGLVDYAQVNYTETSIEPVAPYLANVTQPPEVGQEITIVGFGCSDINKPTTDYDVQRDPHQNKRIGENVVSAVNTKQNTFTFKSTLQGSFKNSGGCPRNKMPKGESADDGSPIFWGKDKSGKPMLGGVVLYSQVVGNQIVTTAKYLANSKTRDFLTKFIGQDAPNAKTPDETKLDMMQNAYSKGGIGAGGIDWQPGHNGKMTCFSGQHATGLYSHSGYATLYCKAKPQNSGEWLDQTVVNTYDSGDKMEGRTSGDWMKGERKFECPKNMFVGGVLMEKGNSRLAAMLCVESKKSSGYKFNQCRTVATYEKEAHCGADEYMGGISLKFHGSPANHVGSLLCCKY